jgi:hypothetical protein
VAGVLAAPVQLPPLALIDIVVTLLTTLLAVTITGTAQPSVPPGTTKLI